jgi:hypothetical protein
MGPLNDSALLLAEGSRRGEVAIDSVTGNGTFEAARPFIRAGQGSGVYGSSYWQKIRDRHLPGNRLRTTSLRFLPKRLFPGFPADRTTVSPQLPDRGLALHPTTTSS